MFSPLILDIIHYKKKRKQVSEKEKRDETSPSKKGDEVVPTAFRFGLSASLAVMCSTWRRRWWSTSNGIYREGEREQLFGCKKKKNRKWSGQ
jgi:hypothetical protein